MKVFMSCPSRSRGAFAFSQARTSSRKALSDGLRSKSTFRTLRSRSAANLWANLAGRFLDVERLPVGAEPVSSPRAGAFSATLRVGPVSGGGRDHSPGRHHPWLAPANRREPCDRPRTESERPAVVGDRTACIARRVAVVWGVDQCDGVFLHVAASRDPQHAGTRVP